MDLEVDLLGRRNRSVWPAQIRFPFTAVNSSFGDPRKRRFRTVKRRISPGSIRLHALARDLIYIDAIHDRCTNLSWACSARSTFPRARKCRKYLVSRFQCFRLKPRWCTTPCTCSQKRCMIWTRHSRSTSSRYPASRLTPGRMDILWLIIWKSWVSKLYVSWLHVTGVWIVLLAMSCTFEKLEFAF